jgi:hypothetical protein
MFMAVKDKKGTHRIIRTIVVDKSKLSAIADLLGLSSKEERALLKPGKIHIVHEATPQRKKKAAKKASSEE